jgi:hypothetical protein
MSFNKTFNNYDIRVRIQNREKKIHICLIKMNPKEKYSSEYNLDFINDKLKKLEDFKKF